MPNLVGIGLSQVPTNSMLGGLAYQNAQNTSIENLNLKNISSINSDIVGTAVDVFVYDTSKDSDGGAWRKRTQNTSWYNETLNTSTRGSRKEFPAVAVCVAEDHKLTIYDGDDPDLPMWMVFNADTTNWNTNATFLSLAYAPTNNMDLVSVKCLNAKLVVSGDQHGVVTIDFINESQNNRRPDIQSGKVVVHKKSGSIASRNDTSGQNATTNTQVIVDGYTNDLAITVLPNAPIDSTTGLPIPTIAVATNGGISVIKDDGVVVDMSEVDANWSSNLVEFFNGKLIHNDHLTGSNNEDYLIVSEIPTSDTNYLGGGVIYNHATTPAINYSRTHDNTDLVSLDNNVFALGVVDSTDHLTLVSDETPQSHSMVAFVTTSFNTGWMHGDIKGAFLSDTDTTNVTGSELITSGNFSSSTGWTLGSGWTISGGKLNKTNTANVTAYYTATGLTVGKAYTFSINVDTVGSGTLYFYALGVYTTNPTLTTTGTHSLTVVANATSLDFGITAISGNGAILDNATLRLAEPDRSVNNNGLQVFGTITKTPVATGADLVAYSGFSASNYLVQPNNSNLAPGTGAYSVSCWFKTSSSGSNDQYIFDRGTSGSASRNLILVMQNSGRIQFYHTNSSGTASDLQTTDLPSVADNSWHQVVGLYDGSAYRVYVDGNASSVTNTTGRDVGNDGSPELTIGTRYNYTQTFGGDLALFRYSRSAPSPEQIKKMYEDEKHLFQENAKATLYGSSDAVTALAFDDTTNLLHVGTSAGRSDFNGLRRINNTTTAVTTAISAHDGSIAQQ